MFKPKENNLNWKGNNVKYTALHQWIRAHKPKTSLCEECKINPPKDVACIKEYTRDINNYRWLCRSCHIKLDGNITNLKNSEFMTLKVGKVRKEKKIKCNFCGEIKYQSCFHRSRIYKANTGKCRDCCNKTGREWYKQKKYIVLNI